MMKFRSLKSEDASPCSSSWLPHYSRCREGQDVAFSPASPYQSQPLTIINVATRASVCHCTDMSDAWGWRAFFFFPLQIIKRKKNQQSYFLQNKCNGQDLLLFVCFNILEIGKALYRSRKGEFILFFDNRRFMSLLTYYPFQRIYIKITLVYEVNFSDLHNDSTYL